MSKMATKENSYREEIVDGRKKFRCLICSRIVTAKRHILQHLHTYHDMSPVKKVKKLCEDDTSVAIPERTKYRWKTKEQTDTEVNVIRVNQFDDTEAGHISSCTYAENLDKNCEHSISCYYSNSDPDEAEGFLICSDDATSAFNSEASGLDSESDVNYCTSESEKSDVSSVSDSSDTLSESDTISSSNEDDNSTGFENDNELPENELQALKILACFQRKNWTKSGCRDILQTMKSVFQDSKFVGILDLDYIYSLVDSHPLREIHYCIKCNNIFPSDVDEFQCKTENCDGLRYQGSLGQQLKPDRQPKRSFIFADIKKQLAHLLQTPGILEDIENCKLRIEERDGSDTLTDITDGRAYRDLLDSDAGFLRASPYNLSAIINTDGINLYSSSKTELWPIFLAINELSPKARFSRDNLLLVGIWQGKGKPPFKQYLECFSEEMSSLYKEGFVIKIKETEIRVKVAVICGVFDLPAKAGILNMTYYNGNEACITCEEPGCVVKQGKGTSRCYPYRLSESRYPLRDNQTVLENMQNGTEKKRIKGFKGISGLAGLHSYDLVKGTVPDYMHGVLLGVTNTLMSLWFSPKQSGKPYFIGKHISTVSKRLQNIKPPHCIERLPRDLEKNFKNLKATELQAWLLFYCLPCLAGILPDIYLHHLSYLSEAIYILLCDRISPEHLEKACRFLETFYSLFEELYGQGSCGLNVHNTCIHLVWYVMQWGPLWAWSCFPFEDNNAVLLQSVHGTRNVTKQLMNYQQAYACLQQKGIRAKKTNLWKVTHRAGNCEISGKLKTFKDDELNDDILKKLNVQRESLMELKKVDRISCDGKQFCSLQYTRMQRRVCDFLLYGDSKVGSAQCFVYNTLSDKVYAILKRYDADSSSKLSQLPAGKQLLPVKSTVDSVDVIAAEELLDTLVYINVRAVQHHVESAYVSLMPNTHGHAIFK